MKRRRAKRLDVVTVDRTGRDAKPQGDDPHWHHARHHAGKLAARPWSMREGIDAKQRRPHEHRRHQVEGVLGLMHVVVAERQPVDRR